MSSTNDPGGCNYSSECSAASYCIESSPVLKCCRYPPACFTEGSGMMAHDDQTISANTPEDAVTRFVRLPKVGMMVIGDSHDFKAGEVIVSIDGLPAYEAATWDAWLKTKSATFKVLATGTRKPTTRTITRL